MEDSIFASTLEAANIFSNNIRCSNPSCNEPSENLQLLGESCKHPFCWNCINKFQCVDTFLLCPRCQIPLDLHKISSAKILNNLSGYLIDLQKMLKNMNAVDCAATQNALCDVFEKAPVVTRTTTEFCASQLEMGRRSPEEDEGGGSPLTGNILSGHPDACNTPRRVAANASPPKEETNSSLFASQMAPIWQPEEEMKWVTAADLTPQSKSARQCRPKATPKRRAAESMKADPVKETVELPKNSSTPRSSARLSAHKGTIQLEELFDKEASTPDRKASSGRKRSSENKKRSLPGKKGETVLINAVIRGDIKQLRKGIETGCDLNERDPDGKTPIYLAAERDEHKMCEALIESGAIINAYCTEECWTPLHAAASVGAEATVRVLLAKGANRRALNARRKTPADVAASEELKELMTRHGSVPLQIFYPKREVRVLLGDNLSPHTRRAVDGLQLCSTPVECTHMVVKSLVGAAEADLRILEAVLCGATIVEDGWSGDDTDYLVRTLTFHDTHGDGFVNARRVKERLCPPLFIGCRFFLCHSKYGPLTKAEVAVLVKAGGGTVLGREPVPSGEEMQPFYAPTLSPFFVLFNPFHVVSQKLTNNAQLNMASYSWFYECILNFELRPVY